MMKKRAILIFLLVLCFTVTAGCQEKTEPVETTEATMAPSQVNVYTYQWELLDGKALLVGIGNMKEKDIVIPTSICLVELNGLLVEEPVYGQEYQVVVKSDAFAECNSIETVTFEDGVAVQDNQMSVKYTGMFKNCKKLKGVYNIPDSVTSMAYTFWGCSALKTVDGIPVAVTDMEGCFRECTALETSPAIPESVTVIKDCFMDCSALRSVGEISASATDFSGVFYNCKRLSAVPKLPDTVIDMKQCFYGCVSLNTVDHLPAQAELLSETFSQCTSLEKLNVPLPESTTDLTGTFSDCYKLTTLPGGLPPRVKNLLRTFKNCYSLVTLEGIMPDTVTNMDYTFEYCTSLESLNGTIPESVTSMRQTFIGCGKLTKVPILYQKQLAVMYSAFLGCSELKGIQLENCPEVELGFVDWYVELKSEESMFGDIVPDIVYLREHKAEGICEGCGIVSGTIEIDGVNVVFWDAIDEVYEEFLDYFQNEVPQELKETTRTINIIPNSYPKDRWPESYRPSEYYSREEYLSKLSGLAFVENGVNCVNVKLCGIWDDTEIPTLIHELSHGFDRSHNPSGVKESQTAEWKEIHEKESAVLAARFYNAEMYGRYPDSQKRVESYAMATEAYFTNPDFLRHNCPLIYQYMNDLWGDK